MYLESLNWYISLQNTKLSNVFSIDHRRRKLHRHDDNDDDEEEEEETEEEEEEDDDDVLETRFDRGPQGLRVSRQLRHLLLYIHIYIIYIYMNSPKYWSSIKYIGHVS